ncbi:hypothetical protein [Ekhidna sp.]|jgi:hypothetical protein|uniref:hypothetical protein n=1 Tax=Ekhidna sp. TaxID=2608089 RepID=UPI0032ECA1FF
MAKKKTEETMNLEDELKKATEEANEVEELEDDFEPSPESFDDEGDFDDFDEPDFDDEADEEPTFSGDPKKTARRWIKTFNALQKWVLKGLYKKKILTSEDSEQIRKWKAQHKANPNVKMEDVIEGDAERYERFDRFLTAVEDLPFTEEEIQDIAEPLSELIEKHRRLQMSPEVALLLAVIIVMLPRLEPILPDMTAIFNRAKKQAE